VIQVTEELRADRYPAVVAQQRWELIMTANIGDFDRVARIVAGLAILALVLVFEGPNRWWALVGFVPLVTGLIRWCPAYLPFGFSTRHSLQAPKSCCG
jgi:sulfite exporter TauE/SafE